MAERRPLVIVGSKKTELPAGDTLPGGGGSGDDDNSGRYFVPVAVTYTVEENFQSINKIGLDLDGTLIVDGQLFMEN